VRYQHAPAAVSLDPKIIEYVSDLELLTPWQILLALVYAGSIFFPHIRDNFTTGETSNGYHLLYSPYFRLSSLNLFKLNARCPFCAPKGFIVYLLAHRKGSGIKAGTWPALMMLLH
jgi:hypothetical protein